MRGVPAAKPELEPTDHRDSDHRADQGARGSSPEHERGDPATRYTLTQIQRTCGNCQ